MKIIDAKIHKLLVPMKPQSVHSGGMEDKLCNPDPVSGRSANFWEFPKWIIELIADNGLIGLGEPRRGDLEGPLKDFANMMIGRTLGELPIGNLPLPHGDDYESYIIYEAFEMAWYDLLGKHLGVPVWHLLGGKRIECVEVDYWMGRCSPEDTAERTRIASRLGFRGVKMKCAWGDPIHERMRAVREVAPHMGVVFDANERLHDLPRAIEVARSLEPFDGIILESPIPQGRLDWYVQLRKQIGHRVALHFDSLRSLLNALKADAADCYNLLGPLTEFVSWARTAQSAGCPVWRGTGIDLGIRDMSSVHAAGAAGCTASSDIIGSFLREDDLIVDPIHFVNGAIEVPDRPGLGVELDRDALERYRAE